VKQLCPVAPFREGIVHVVIAHTFAPLVAFHPGPPHPFGDSSEVVSNGGEGTLETTAIGISELAISEEAGPTGTDTGAWAGLVIAREMRKERKREEEGETRSDITQCCLRKTG